jgi:hypothetical protein
VFLTLQLISVLAIGLLLGVSFLLCGPFFEIAAPQQSWRPAVLLTFVFGVGCVAAGMVISGRSPLHPQRDTMVYSMNGDTHKAAWISYDRSLDAWTSKVFHAGARRVAAPEYLAGWTRPVFVSPANVAEMRLQRPQKNQTSKTANFVMYESGLLQRDRQQLLP